MTDTILKVVFFFISAIIMLISYFQAKEARKMESKLRISLPGSVSLAISFQLVLSFAAFTIATLLLII